MIEDFIGQLCTIHLFQLLLPLLILILLHCMALFLLLDPTKQEHETCLCLSSAVSHMLLLGVSWIKATLIEVFQRLTQKGAFFYFLPWVSLSSSCISVLLLT